MLLVLFVCGALVFTLPQWIGQVWPQNPEARAFEGVWRSVDVSCADPGGGDVVLGRTAVQPAGATAINWPRFDVRYRRNDEDQRRIWAETDQFNITATFTELRPDHLRFDGFYYAPRRGPSGWLPDSEARKYFPGTAFLKRWTELRPC
jgi:hypothetical protein